MTFRGFSKESLQFFTALGSHNNRSWFEENRGIFDTLVMPESQDFVVAMGSRLADISDDIIADPRTDRSIFRIHRDTRFSKDKSPYKTHLALVFWEGPFKKVESPLFYFHLEPQKLLLAAGMHMIPGEFLESYRAAVDDQKTGASLEKAIKEVRKKGSYELGWEKYKQVPRGYHPAHPRGHLLKFGGIGFYLEMPVPVEIFDERSIEFVYRHFENMSPVYNWVRQIMYAYLR
jgi:uncharacterized protein (TIGR02453 family)